MFPYLWSVQSYEQPPEDYVNLTVVRIVQQKEKSYDPTQSQQRGHSQGRLQLFLKSNQSLSCCFHQMAETSLLNSLILLTVQFVTNKSVHIILTVLILMLESPVCLALFLLATSITRAIAINMIQLIAMPNTTGP